MELQGTIIRIYDAKTGISKSTGNSWMTQDYTIEFTQGQYAKHMTFSIFGEDKIKNIGLQLNEEVVVHFDIDAKEWNGRYYNDIRAWKVDRSQNAGQQATSQIQNTPTPTPAPIPTVNFDEQNDDTPF